MSMKRIADALTVIVSLGILYIGVQYVLDPQGIAAGFGLHNRPEGDGGGFLNLKGIRDITTGLLGLTLLATRQRQALGTVLLVLTIIPLGDMLTVLGHHGSTAAALGIHGATAVLVAATGALVLRTRHALPGRARRTAAVPSTQVQA